MTDKSSIDWDSLNPNMLVNVNDMKYYYDNFTSINEQTSTANKLAIQTLDGRVTKIEQEIPEGGGGTGAFLNLGGTPEVYPTAEQMQAPAVRETGFLVVAREDGLYFYNPATGLVIPPKKGGGTIAVHGQFPQIFDLSHSLTYDGRAGLSGVYTAKVADIGLETEFAFHDTCKVLIVVNDIGEEYQTAFSPDGMASRIFRKGSAVATWGVAAGGGGGGSGLDPAVIQEINRRLDALEASGGTGGVAIKYLPFNDVSTRPFVGESNLSETQTASTNTVIIKGSQQYTVTLPKIAAHNADTIGNDTVREGRMTYVINMSTSNKTVRLSSGTSFYVEGNMDTANALLTPKTAFVYQPAIIDNGSGVDVPCWVFMGSFPITGVDVGSITAELADLQAKHGLQETAIDSLEERFTIMEAGDREQDAALERHIKNFEDMRDGNMLTAWNGLGCRPMSMSGDVGASNIASVPFVVGQGTLSGKKFTMPEVVSMDATTLTSTQVREGRLTLIINTGTKSRSVELTASCKFNMSGSNITTAQTIPPKTVWVFSPGIYSNKDKVWTFLGSFSAETVDLKEFMDRINALTGATLAQSVAWSSGNLTISNTASYNMLTQESAAAVPLYWLPDIKLDTESASSTEVKVGRLQKFLNSSTNTSKIGVTGSCKIMLADKSLVTELLLPSGHSFEAVAENHSREGRVWRVFRMGPAVYTPVDLNTVNGRIDNVEDVNLVQDGQLADHEVRMVALEAIPAAKSKFSELDDTPNDYRPGRILAYNMAGDAITSIAPTDQFKNLTDTPNDYTGQRQKMVTVNSTEDGLEFTAVPNLTPLQTEINDLHNEIVRLDNEQYIQDQATSAIDTRVAALEAGGGATVTRFTDLTDTPANFTGQAGKAVTVNSTNNGLVFTTVPTEAAVAANTTWRTQVTSGDSAGKVSSNCIFNAMHIVDGNITAADLSSNNTAYVRGTTARSAVLPKVVDANASTVAEGEARFGKLIRLVNYSTQNLTVTVNGGGRIYRTGQDYATTVTIAANQFADFHAVWFPHNYNNFAWCMVKAAGITTYSEESVERFEVLEDRIAKLEEALASVLAANKEE